MGKKLNIVIVNAHWSNRGDEAALRVVIDRILEKYDCKIEVIFKDNEEVKQFPYKGNVTCFSAKFLPQNFLTEVIAVLSRGKIGADISLQRSIQSIKRSDVIIYAPGGSVICNRFFWRKQLEYLLPFLCAKIYKIPMFVAAPSLGPFGNHICRNFIIRRLLKVPEVICVRENISKVYLAGIGVSENVITTVDTAFFDAADCEMNECILKGQDDLGGFLQKYERIVGITISDFSWHVKYSKNMGLKIQIENVMNWFMEKMREEGIGVLLIPQLFGNQNDTEFLEKFQNSNTFLLSDEVDAYFQQYIISKLYAVVGMRYHSNIFAAKAGVPFLAIVYEEKMRGFMEMWNLENYAIMLEDLSADSLLEKWDKLVGTYDSYKADLMDNCLKWKKEAEKTLRSMEMILNRLLSLSCERDDTQKDRN